MMGAWHTDTRFLRFSVDEDVLEKFLVQKTTTRVFVFLSDIVPKLLVRHFGRSGMSPLSDPRRQKFLIFLHLFRVGARCCGFSCVCAAHRLRWRCLLALFRRLCRFSKPLPRVKPCARCINFCHRSMHACKCDIFLTANE